MPRGKEQKLHLIVKRPNQCCQARLCSAQGLEPQPLLTSKMLLFLQLASAGVAEACLNPPKQRELCSREPWVRLLGLVFFLVYSSQSYRTGAPKRAGFHFMLPRLSHRVWVPNDFTAALQSFVLHRPHWILACRGYHWFDRFVWFDCRSCVFKSISPPVPKLTHKCSNHQQHLKGGSALPRLWDGMGEPGGLLFFPVLFF